MCPLGIALADRSNRKGGGRRAAQKRFVEVLSRSNEEIRSRLEELRRQSAQYSAGAEVHGEAAAVSER